MEGSTASLSQPRPMYGRWRGNFLPGQGHLQKREPSRPDAVTMARIHYLQHVPFEGLGSMESWLTTDGHTVTATRFFAQPADLPSPTDFDALIVMGGPMSVFDEQNHPWLVVEKSFMRACLQAGKKVLGICLGAQLLADCLGAHVHPAPYKEIGWFPVYPAEDSWVSRLFVTHPTVFHWHGDQFDIPEGATDIIHTSANCCQAFHMQDSIIGLQFHLEVTSELLADMMHHGAGELVDAPTIQSAIAILEGTAHIAAAQQLLNEIMKRWLYSWKRFVIVSLLAALPFMSNAQVGLVRFLS